MLNRPSIRVPALCETKLLLAAILLAGLAMPLTAFAEDAEPAAEPAAEIPSSSETQSVDALIADLTADAYAARETATQQLMEHPDLTDERLAQAIADAELPERIHRLRRVAMHRFYYEMNPRNQDRHGDAGGGLGIALSEIGMKRVLSPEDFPELDHHAVLITEKIPGFPAFVHLRSGDMIVGIDGEFFDETLTLERGNPASFQDRYLGEYRAGDEITFHVVRNREQIDVTVTLDNRDRITDVHAAYNAVEYPNLYAPYMRHISELAPTESQPIEIHRPDAQPVRSAATDEAAAPTRSQ